MKAFCLVTLVSLVAANADADTQFTAFTAFGGQASHATHQAAPVVHHIAHHAVAHHTVAYQAYEQPKQNCSVPDVVEVADVGTPALDTVCQPDAGYGYHEYSHNYCKEDAQGTCYNVPGLNFVESAVEVTYPEPIQTGGNEPISLPRISCEDLSEEK